MLRRHLVFLILGGLVAVCTCEPVNRKLLRKASEKSIECGEDEGDTSLCGTNDTADALLPNYENRTSIEWIARGIRQLFLEEDTGEVSARKKKRHGRLLFLMLGAMKAALVYGVLHGVAALAGKALLIAKIALAVAIAAILKKNDHSEKVSYEIVKHPHTSYIQTHSSSVDYDHRSDYPGEDHYDRTSMTGYENHNNNRKRRRIR